MPGWACAIAVVGALLAAGPATAQGPRGIEVLGEALGSTLDPRAAAAAVAEYERSWTHRALGLQEALARDVGLRDAPFLGTHNSFNSVAEMGLALSPLDSNQKLTLTDQLRLNVRSLELDVHWLPSPRAAGAFAPVVCHGAELHAGCTIERLLGPLLDEIGAWLRAHRDQVLLLYIQDELDTAAGHDAGAATLQAHLGDLLFRPAGAGCSKLPLDLTREDVLAAGRQVVVMGGCGVGAAWPTVSFDGSDREEARPNAFADFPGCGPDFDRATYEAKLVRYFEDSTGVTATASAFGAASSDEGITPQTAGRMARCGVDLLGLDQLLPGDGRLEALVWSWAEGEPRARRRADCAIQRTAGRWEAWSCRVRRQVACRTAAGAWVVPSRRVAARRAGRLCRARGGVHAVPRTGYEGQLLRVAMRRTDATRVLLGMRRRGERWVALDAR